MNQITSLPIVHLDQLSVHLDHAIANLKSKSAEARKVIKLELAQQSWKEFGISEVR